MFDEPPVAFLPDGVGVAVFGGWDGNEVAGVVVEWVPVGVVDFVAVWDGFPVFVFPDGAVEVSLAASAPVVDAVAPLLCVGVAAVAVAVVVDVLWVLVHA